MNSSLAYGSYGSATQDRTRTLFAANIFLDALNAFLFFLRIFSGGRD
jgi:FtsH-binding integral membrane protein